MNWYTMKEKILSYNQRTIIGKTVKLIPFTETHLRNPNYLSWLHDYEVIRYLNLPAYVKKPVSFEEVKNYVRSIIANESTFFYAVETLDNQFIGTFKIGHIDWHAKNVNLGIMIGDKNYWGKGIGKELFSIAIEFCFSELEMHKVYGGCMGPNISMRTVFLSLGFKEEGCFRERDFFENKFSDHFHYGLLRQEYLKQKQ